MLNTAREPYFYYHDTYDIYLSDTEEKVKFVLSERRIGGRNVDDTKWGKRKIRGQGE